MTELQYTKPLPQCEGPKLKPFRNPRPTITFHRLLSDKDADGHAHIFEVSIASKKYALKMFKFYNAEEVRAELLDHENELVTDEILQAHEDPFFNECRAYGRLEERKLNGKVAVRCHGYITVPAEKEEELENKFGILDWDRPGDEDDIPPSKQHPFRAIVKDLILEDIRLTGKLVNKMLRDLKKIRRCGIFPSDIRERNYKAGLLVDFSVARTEPHYLFDLRAGVQERLMKNDDLYMWQDMVEENKLETRLRAVPNREYCKKLRSHKRTRSSVGSGSFLSTQALVR